MHFFGALCVVAVILGLAAAFPHGNTNSICDRYSRALKITNLQLLQSVVNGTVTAVVAKQAPTKKYFDGRQPPGSTNFLTNPAALASLQNSLVNFFFGPLGCTDRPLRNYTGRSMKSVHSGMSINDADFTFFVNALLGVLTKSGVTPVDVKTVRGVLESTRKDIVTVKAASICDKYSRALKLSNAQLVTTIVNNTIKLLVGPTAPTKKYFDGTKPAGSTNFLRNPVALAGLTKSLVNFFWAPLGCSIDRPPRVYTGGSMKDVHASMGINNAEMTFFKNALSQVLTKAGVAAADVKTVAGVIESLRSQIVTRT